MTSSQTFFGSYESCLSFLSGMRSKYTVAYYSMVKTSETLWSITVTYVVNETFIII
jgi:hypothetical protein